MDARPKSNKQKRLEKKRKLELAAVACAQENAREAEAERIARAVRVLRESKTIRRDLPRFLERLAAGEPAPTAMPAELDQLARLFATVNKQKPNRYPLMPDVEAFQRLIEVCWERTELLRGRETLRFAGALLALSAHRRAWVRKPGTWMPRTHNASRQFHSLVRHLVALYDVPGFMNSAWLEGLTQAGVVQQAWFIHVAQGGNLRTAQALPIPLTRKQAHLYLQAPGDFDALSAFRWAQVLDMGGDGRLARSIVGTVIGRSFDHDDFWVTVVRWLVEQPMLDPVHHAPIIDYLHNQRFVASAPNPRAGLQGQPALVPPQPNLTMKGRDAEGLLRAVEAWHRRLGRVVHGPISYWRPTGIAPFRHEEGEGKSRKVFTITELLSSHELLAEGQAMAHCVASYAPSCVRGVVSIWSLRLTGASGQETRLLTLEVVNREHQIVQARRKCNALPSERELAILRRWAAAGGPTLSGWVAR
jgi:PcfJ-like protein